MKKGINQYISFDVDDELSLTDMFKRMNQLLKVMGLQIRSLMLQEYVGGDDEVCSLYNALKISIPNLLNVWDGETGG